ncbi:hypothetical protein SprV_0301236600 [Sparganum proliferum]
MVNLYRRFLWHGAEAIMQPTNHLSGPKRLLELSTDALVAFDQVKTVLAHAALLTHSTPDAFFSFMVDISNVAVVAVPQQHLAGQTQLLALLSRTLSVTKWR